MLAQYPGGEGAMLTFLSEHISYPKDARVNGIEGTVYVEFVVNTDGSISDTKIVRDIGGGCAERVERV